MKKVQKNAKLQKTIDFTTLFFSSEYLTVKKINLFDKFNW